MEKIRKDVRLTLYMNKAVKSKIKEVAKNQKKTVGGYLESLIIADLQQRGESVIVQARLV